MQIGAIAPLNQRLRQVEDQVVKTQNEVNMESFQTYVLDHVIFRDKKDINFLKIPIEENKKAIRDIDMTLDSMKQLRERNKTEMHSMKTR